MISPDLPARYLVLGLLGEGGSGRVFHVRDSLRDRDLALKLVTAEERKFLRLEFDTLRQIRHENLVQVFDWGSLPSEAAYYTMELVEGSDWGQRMSAAQPADEVRRLLTGLLRGVAHLHCHGEIHGDLKPGNVLLGRGGVVKVTDVGMGGADGAREGLAGTPGYAAPEIWEGAKADIRSDLYSIGVMAYEALTGTHPFGGRTIREVVAGQIEGWVPSPAVHGVRVPPDLERVVMRALERDPGLRQSSADEFMEGMGVEDRIGEILGGRFADRSAELERLLEAIHVGRPDRPTLFRITGPPGIGTSRLASELADRAVVSLAHVVNFTGIPEHLVEEPGGGSTEAMADASNRISAIAQPYLDRSGDSLYIALCDDDAGPSGQVMSQVEPLARYLRAVAVERGEPVPVFFVATGPDTKEQQGEYAFELSLGPLERAAHDELVRGFLGRTSISNLALERLFAESGGNPGACHSLLLDLIDRRVLNRSAGTWTENPPGAIQSLQFTPTTNPLSVALRHVDGDALDVLISLGLLRRGIAARDLVGVLQTPDLDGVLYRLSMKGWVRFENGRCLLTSGSVRTGVMEAAGSDRIREVAGHLRRLQAAALDDATRLEVNLAAGHIEGQVRKAIALSGAEIRQGNAATAVRWLDGVLAGKDEASSNGELVEANVMLAGALLELGEYERAVDVLSSAENFLDSVPTRSLVERELALGRALRSLGRVSESRRAIERARLVANREGLLGLELTSETYLAGIEWELGDESARAVAIDRVSHLLSRTPAQVDLLDERAALSYNLGAAMIRAGRYSEARNVLGEAATVLPSRYWQMRIRNASSIAEFRLGHPDAALSHIEEAWQLAEEIGADSFRPRILTNRGGYLYSLGKIRDAAESDRQGARWAKRFGDSLEYLIGCVGAAICLTVMGRYEEGLTEAHASEETATAIGDSRHLARALEVQAIIHNNLGLAKDAELLLQAAREAYRGQEYVDLGPRLDWLGARLIAAKGDREDAIEQLRRVEAALRAAPDLEDLWGVQVELSLLTSEEDPRSKLAIVLGIARDARESSVLVAEVSALAAIGEILMERGIDEGDFAEMLSSGLARAEEQGMLEASWQLSYWLGRIALRSGNRKAVQSRFGHAIRVLREISGALTSDHARSYLSSPKVSSALRQMGAT